LAHPHASEHVVSIALPATFTLAAALLIVRRVLREQFVIQHRRLLAIVRDDEVCRRHKIERLSQT
jgi:hypothetical protein